MAGDGSLMEIGRGEMDEERRGRRKWILDSLRVGSRLDFAPS